MAKVSKWNFEPNFTEDMQKQIDAAIWLIDRNIHTLDDYDKQYLQKHLKNLVETCLSLGTVPAEVQTL